MRAFFNSFKCVLLALCLFLPVTASALAIGGNTFRLVNMAYDMAVTNGDKGVHNTYLTLGDIDETSPGQEWAFVQMSSDEPVYLVYNATYTQWSHTIVRVGPQRKQKTKELMPLNCGAGEDS